MVVGHPCGGANGFAFDAGAVGSSNSNVGKSLGAKQNAVEMDAFAIF